MLLNLHVKNMALIDNIDISFDDHLNILTGETGAGKSIIIGSIAFGLGGRMRSDMVRTDAEYGLCELLFSVDNETTRKSLSDRGIDIGEDGELLISRKITGNKVINKLNGDTVTASVLKDCADILLDLHAQHEQQALKKPGYQMGILDRFGGESVSSLLEKVKKACEEYHAVRDELNGAMTDSKQQKRELDLIRYELSEIENAGLFEGEDEEIAKRYKKLKYGRDIIEYVNRVHAICGYEEDASAGSLIGNAMSMMNSAAELDDELKPIASELIDIDALLADLNRDLSDYMSSLSFDEQEFFEVEKRLDVINGLKIKYGNSIKAILEYADKRSTELLRLENYEEYLSELKEREEKAKAEYLSLSRKLHSERTKLSKKLSELIKTALSELNFLDVVFEINVEDTGEITSKGSDKVTFMISTNVGENMRPLSDVASGGELSRIMLAIKAVLADVDETDTLIFDEIDVGISGRTAQMVSEKLATIAKSRQVISITHLPQIAAIADANYLIEKQVKDGKTVTDIRRILDADIVNELSRLIGGVEITEAVKNSAAEMKKMADEVKQKL
ncbi:MAG: DNA repair protein RecN [Lachnospiraceae bacterium]|nr:DNA repair protein RecN [Lachnospiraceae bacterium]